MQDLKLILKILRDSLFGFYLFITFFLLLEKVGLCKVQWPEKLKFQVTFEETQDSSKRREDGASSLHRPDFGWGGSFFIHPL